MIVRDDYPEGGERENGGDGWIDDRTSRVKTNKEGCSDAPLFAPDKYPTYQ